MNQLNSQNVLPRVEFRVHFQNGHCGRKQLRTGENERQPAGKHEDLPRLTRLLALAHRWNRLIEEGIVDNYAEIARMMGLSRARVTQIMDLLYLAPEIQEEIISANDKPQLIILERSVRKILRLHDWIKQRELWLRLHGSS